MSILILKDNKEFSALTSDIIAQNSFIAYGDGNGYFRIVKHKTCYGARVPDKTLHWYISEKNLNTEDS